MTKYEFNSCDERFITGYYVKGNSDYINMHEVRQHFQGKYNIYFVIGYAGWGNRCYFAIVEWRNEWYGTQYPVIYPIVQSVISVSATNTIGTLAFNNSGITFIVMPIGY